MCSRVSMGSFGPVNDRTKDMIQTMQIPTSALRHVRSAMFCAAVVWCGVFMAIAHAQQRRPVDPAGVTIEAFRFQSLEDRTTLLESSRFEFSAQVAALRVSVEELTKTQDATRSLLVGMCAPLLALCGEMFMRLFVRSKG